MERTGEKKKKKKSKSKLAVIKKRANHHIYIYDHHINTFIDVYLAIIGYTSITIAGCYML
jgi:hypothetical protein